MNEGKKVHIIAVCGTAMASYAGMLKERGYAVSGSDQNMYPPMSDQLAALGIQVFEGYRPENLAHRPDLVVVGNTIKKDNPELNEVLRLGLPYTSFPASLSELFLQDRQPLVIAGTHGKTTTTSLAAWVLHQCGADPSFMIGGIPLNYGRSYRLGQGQPFVIEGDEYSTSCFDRAPKFLHYRPTNLILTGIEYDHADIYDSLESIVLEFTRLVKLLPPEGIISVCADNQTALDVVQYACCGTETYGLYNPNAEWTAKNIDFNGSTMTFSIFCNKVEIGRYASAIVGEHNLQNILGVFSMAMRLGLDKDQVGAALLSFQGVKRRMELFAEVSGVTIIDDFAHHPTAIRETVKAIRHKYPDRRLWTVFEPRTNSTRRNIFQHEIAASLREAGNVLIAPVFRPELIAPEERFNPSVAIATLLAEGVSARHPAHFDELLAILCNEVRAGDLVLVLSNGGFNGLHGKLRDHLATRIPPTTCCPC